MNHFLLAAIYRHTNYPIYQNQSHREKEENSSVWGPKYHSPQMGQSCSFVQKGN